MNPLWNLFLFTIAKNFSWKNLSGKVNQSRVSLQNKKYFRNVGTPLLLLPPPLSCRRYVSLVGGGRALGAVGAVRRRPDALLRPGAGAVAAGAQGREGPRRRLAREGVRHCRLVIRRNNKR